MIARYTRPDMGRIWNEENKFRQWLAVEVAATETLAEAGIVPRRAARAIRAKGDFELARIHEIESEVKHDVIAFTTAVAEKVGPESRWLHYGLTSNDVVDTAQALQLKAASELILAGIERLRAMIAQHGARCDLEVDGGISAATAPQAVRAGANVLVAGSAVYADPAGPGAGIATLRAAIG